MISKFKNVSVVANGSKVEYFVFQLSKTTTGLGNQLTIPEGAKTLTLFVVHSATGLRIDFRGYSQYSSGYIPVVGINLSTLDTALYTDGTYGIDSTRELWQFDILGLDLFAAEITAINSGSVSVRGKLVYA